MDMDASGHHGVLTLTTGDHKNIGSRRELSGLPIWSWLHQLLASENVLMSITCQAWNHSTLAKTWLFKSPRARRTSKSNFDNVCKFQLPLKHVCVDQDPSYCQILVSKYATLLMRLTTIVPGATKEVQRTGTSILLVPLQSIGFEQTMSSWRISRTKGIVERNKDM